MHYSYSFLFHPIWDVYNVDYVNKCTIQENADQPYRLSLRNITRTYRSFEHILNPFTLRVPLERIFCYSHIFENYWRIKHKFTKHLKESCCLASNKHFSLKYFSKIASIRRYYQNRQACFGLSECDWVNYRYILEAFPDGRVVYSVFTDC